ncbi:MAG TPA: serine/threonine-protein kinase, partial [Polyangiaceae bacterium]|nr:serine/threonine-protein kinase [Polyangiaceae bacterium]
DGELLMVMNYLEGGSLGEMLAASYDLHRRIPPAVALRIVIEAARGLHSAHELRGDDGRPLGIVHRDVSPQNILVGVDGRSAIVDFGVAKAANIESTRTATDVLKGKMAYMAPEYVSKRVSTPQADVFSLGVVCWEALAHRRLFKGEDEMDTMQRVLAPTPAPMLNEISAIDLNVSAIVARALVKDATKRFRSALEFADALESKAAAYEVLATRAEVAASLKSLLATQLDERKLLLREALSERRSVGFADPESTTAPRAQAPSFGASAPIGAFGAQLMSTPRASSPAIPASAADAAAQLRMPPGNATVALPSPLARPAPPSSGPGVAFAASPASAPASASAQRNALRGTVKLEDVAGFSQTPAPITGAASPAMLAGAPPLTRASIWTAMWIGVAVAGVIALGAAGVLFLRGSVSNAATSPEASRTSAAATPASTSTSSTPATETSSSATSPSESPATSPSESATATASAEVLSAPSAAPVVLGPSSATAPTAPLRTGPRGGARASGSTDWRPKTNPYQ